MGASLSRNPSMKVIATAISNRIPDTDNYFIGKLKNWVSAYADRPAVLAMNDSIVISDEEEEGKKETGSQSFLKYRNSPRSDSTNGSSSVSGSSSSSFVSSASSRFKAKTKTPNRERIMPYYNKRAAVKVDETMELLLYKKALSFRKSKEYFKHPTFKRPARKLNTASSSNQTENVSLKNWTFERFFQMATLVDRPLQRNGATESSCDVNGASGDSSVKMVTSKTWLDELRKDLDALRKEREEAEAVHLKALELIEARRAESDKKKKPKSVRPQFVITKEIRNEIARMYQLPGTQIVSELMRQMITRADLDTLKGLQWLNDSVINFYMNLIVDRSQRAELGLPKVFAFSTYFYMRVREAGHAAVKRWTRREDIFSHDIIIIPVHQEIHWCLATIDFRKKQIRYYDSMMASGGNAADECLAHLLKYLQDEKRAKTGTEFDTRGWSLEFVKGLPQQGNGSDCGMFACKFAEYVARDAPIDFTQKDMPMFREKMVYEIMCKKLF